MVQCQAAGFTAVWLLPPYKRGAESDDVGCGVCDRYDLGEFDQKGSISSRYGTREELRSAVKAWGASRKGDETDHDVYAYSRAGDGTHRALATRPRSRRHHSGSDQVSPEKDGQS
jgi:hypothetical protein